MHDHVDFLCMVKECRDPEEECGAMFTDTILSGEMVWCRSLHEGGDQECRL